MKNYLILLILLVSTSSYAQDFRFRGKTSSIVTKDFIRGDDNPSKEDEDNKKVSVSFDGATLLIGKSSYKYIWHQKAKNTDIMQLNFIEKVETSDYPYIDAKFELDFLPENIVKIEQFRETSPTTFSKIIYTVNIVKTSD